MDQKNNQSHGQGNGFLLGVIVGVIITLLFTTKRGREIIKDAMEKGTDKFSHLEKLMKESEAEDLLEDEENDFVPSELAEVAPETAKEKKEQITNKPEETKPEPQTIKEPLPTPKAVKEEAPEHVVHEKQEKKEEKKEEKPKTIRGKRWFRGLRKKS